MKSPAEMDIIQIDITNDCFNRCSNCSRFSGNHKKVTYMDWDTFKKACESLKKEFKGLVGIMGGEPTLHPDFDRFVRYYDMVIPRDPKISQKLGVDINSPINDINDYQQTYWKPLPGKKRGLWTSFGPGYARHFELIRHVFEYQCINDHKSSIMHQVSMLARKELNIPDDKWEILRDNCWLQNNWSASITPKGAFFCEIAGALDLLFEGPGGWPVEPGWWQRKPEDFKDQLHWCEMCSFCLNTPYAASHENTDVVSPEWDRKLNELGSKKKRVIFDVTSYDPDKYKMSDSKVEPYIMESSNLKRADISTSRYLSLNKIILLMVSIGYSGTLKETLNYNRDEADEIIVVTEESDIETIKVCEQYKAHIVLSTKKHLNGAFFNKGALINDGVLFAKDTLYTPWIILTDADVILPTGFKKTWSTKILNPGTLYYAERVHIKKEEISKYMINPLKLKALELRDHNQDRYPWGFFQLFNINAQALKGREKPYSEEFLSAGHVDKDFLRLWNEDRRYFIGTRVIHIDHGTHGAQWGGISR